VAAITAGSGHEAGLVDWADTAGLAAATYLARTNVVTVAAAVGRHHIHWLDTAFPVQRCFRR
jgi:hypothetical protein